MTSHHPECPTAKSYIPASHILTITTAIRLLSYFLISSQCLFQLHEDSQALAPVWPLDLGKRGPHPGPHNLEGSTLTLFKLCLFLWGKESAGPREHAHQSPCPPSPFLDQTLDTEDLSLLC